MTETTATIGATATNESTPTNEPLAPSTTSVRWVTTTAHDAFREQPDLSLSRPSGMPDVIISTDRAGHRIEGFGAAFNEMGWSSLGALSEAQREQILREFFAPGVGGNFTMARMPLGANDFSRDWYSYDEVEDDFGLEHFSIANDLETLVPFIHAALAHQPDLKIWASPWSPPTWLKTNGHYAGARPMPGLNPVENGLRPDQVGLEGTDMMKQDDRSLSTYAEYFGRFIDAYSEQGIEVTMVMPQNEFNSAQPFPSCTWTPGGLARFIRILGPQMREREVAVFLGTLERANPELMREVLADAEAASYIEGVGVQWHGKAAMPFLHRDYAGLRLYQTEQECGDGRNDWRFARYAWSMLRDYFTNGANAYLYWNLALERGGVSRWGWSQNSLVVVDAEAGTFEFSHDYSVLKHVSHFVRPGARFVPSVSYSGYENQLAFLNPDGSVVVVIQNDSAEDQSVSLLIDGRAVAVVLPADSLSTFVVPAGEAK
ncbi:glycoside hydrolase family 30 protein [Subtercola endophyticus]|uniref:glycoside hydrolase family 30 protein n=1 Tax=Subtercola endophyticus TaxID=2895559 RepID=UPI001E3C657B|nr:glycoside hydrolase family 30 beta sandwich domain-containing protein [Subtercola endophyticus]UFS60632.1 beta-glycosidase [Subtercola endophyticus]